VSGHPQAEQALRLGPGVGHKGYGALLYLEQRSVRKDAPLLSGAQDTL
jgi:hypothetical protein